MTRSDPAPARKTQIVVVGGGAGGLELVARLGAVFGRRQFDIILVEKSRTHIWKPLLHEVAAGSLDANLDEVGYRSHGHRWGYRFFYGAMEGIDRASRHVLIAPILDEDGSEIMGHHRIRYDYLVLALGSVSNDFGTPGVARNCLFLDSRAQADRFRTKLLNYCLKASRLMSQDPTRGRSGEHRHCRRRRHRSRACRRALQRRGGIKALRPGSVRRKPSQGHVDRGGAAHPAAIAGETRRRGARRTGKAGRAGDRRYAGGGSDRGRHGDAIRRADPGGPAPLGGGGEGPRCVEGHRRAGDQPQQPVARAPDLADHPRRPHLRYRRLLLLRARGRDQRRAAPRPGGAPDGGDRVPQSAGDDQGPAAEAVSAIATMVRWCRSAISPRWAA